MSESIRRAEYIQALVSFLPPALARAIHQDPRPLIAPRAERFYAAVLLSDVSGFTALTGELAAFGAPGVEELTDLLNRYFSAMIVLLEAGGGEVVQFSGDALIAVFPVADSAHMPDAVLQARAVAEQMQAAMAEFARLGTSVGERALAMKVAIGAGEVLAMSVGGVFQRWQYVIAGSPLRQVGEAESRARRGEIVLSPEAAELLDTATGARLPALQSPVHWHHADETTIAALRLHIPRAITARLDSDQEAWLAELRRMSMLFLGVGGLSDVDSLERYQASMRALQKFTYRYEGSINKFQVDEKGVIGVVLFGAPPLAHPDDPLRAVRCALDLQEAAGPLGLRLAIGITTGQVFAGPVGSSSRREYTVMGDLVNLAARLMQSAGAGGIFCDYPTYRAASSELIWDELPPLTLKGKAASVRAYRPLQLASATAARAARRNRDDLRPLIGRTNEWQRLASALDELEAGHGRLLNIEGEEGIGKSRMVAELGRLMRTRGFSGLLGSAGALDRDTPYFAWREIVGSYFDLENRRAGITRRDAVLSRIEQIAPELSERAPLLNDLLDLDLPDSQLTAGLEPVQRQTALMTLLVELLQLWVAEQPLVLVLEDAHWLDPLSWDLVGLVARSLADQPLLLVLVRRRPASQAEQLRILIGTDLIATMLELGPLTAPESAILAAECLDVQALHETLATLINQRAAGNPLVIEELALSLRDSQALRIENGVAALQADPIDLRLPETLQSLVLSRLDLLPPDVLLTLKVAAVVGPTFERSLIIAVHPAREIAGLFEQQLALLRERELIVSGGENPEILRFRQAVMQEMAYSTLLPTQRRDLHKRVAQWYEQQPAEVLNGNLPQLVYHWRQAEHAEHERHFAVLTGRKFAAEYANAAALRYLNRALQLADRDSLRLELLRLRLEIHERIGEREAQRADLEQLAGLITLQADGLEQARLHNAWSAYFRDISEFVQALQHLDQAEVQAQRSADQASLARSLTLRGEVYEVQGDLAAARDCFEQALTIYQLIGYRRGEANNRSRLGNLSYYSGDFATARGLFLETLALRRAIHDADECITLNNLAEAELKLGNREAAQLRWNEALSAARRVGNRSVEALVLGQIGYAALAQGEYTSALEQIGRGVQIFQQLGDRRRAAESLNDLGMLFRDIGGMAQARHYFEQALAAQDAIGDAPNAAFTALNLGRSLIQDQPERAGELYARALAYACESGERETEAYARSYLAHLYEQRAQLDAAAAEYQRALELRAELEMPSAEDLAGLARIATAANDHSAAVAHAQAALESIAVDGVDSLEFPLLVYLSCYDALLAAGEQSEAQTVLRAAGSLLLERMNSIDDHQLRSAMVVQNPDYQRILSEYHRVIPL